MNYETMYVDGQALRIMYDIHDPDAQPLLDEYGEQYTGKAVLIAEAQESDHFERHLSVVYMQLPDDIGSDAQHNALYTDNPDFVLWTTVKFYPATDKLEFKFVNPYQDTANSPFSEADARCIHKSVTTAKHDATQVIEKDFTAIFNSREALDAFAASVNLPTPLPPDVEFTPSHNVALVTDDKDVPLRIEYYSFI